MSAVMGDSRVLLPPGRLRESVDWKTGLPEEMDWKDCIAPEGRREEEAVVVLATVAGVPFSWPKGGGTTAEEFPAAVEEILFGGVVCIMGMGWVGRAAGASLVGVVGVVVGGWRREECGGYGGVMVPTPSICSSWPSPALVGGGGGGCCVSMGESIDDL